MTDCRRLVRRRVAGAARWAAPALFFLVSHAGLGGVPVLALPAGEAESSIPARLATRSLLLDAVERGDLWVAVGERGHILVSHDRGASWTQSSVPTRVSLTGVWMHDARLGWAVGHDETILRTRDGGASWELVHAAPEAERPLLDVWFRDAENGIAVGAYGTLLATRDGGTTWNARPVSAEDFHLNQIAAAADGTLYIAGEAGHLYRSDDHGETWQTLPAPYEGSFFGVLPLSDGALLAFGLRGKLFRSEDHGATWAPVASGTEATLLAGLELGGGRVLVVGLAGALLRSDDGGRSFRATPLADRKANVALLGAGGHVVLFGEGGARPLEGDR